MSDPCILKASNIQKSFFRGKTELQILKNLDLEVKKGEALCIVGSSGAGKSTLLHILGTLDRPTHGEILYKGEKITDKSDKELALFRNRSLGFVFQFHHLLTEFTSLENVALPLRIGGVSKARAYAKARDLLKLLGMDQRREHYPSELSGGEQQRVAVARALIQRPEILLADEPTGNLDTDNGRMIQDLFLELREELGLTLIVVSHDPSFASRFQRVLTLKDGLWEA